MAGLLLLASGGLSYALGQWQNFILLELCGFLLSAMAATLIIGGGRLLEHLGYPLFLMLFAIPYPSWAIDYLTIPLKVGISKLSVDLLYIFGYPVAESGVVIALGPYRLMVQDACSGLHSLIFLTALGVMYIYLTEPRKAWHRFLLILSLVPIAIFANFVRVILLLLITYHLGDAIGQSYWHDLAGLLLFLSAFFCLYSLDSLTFSVSSLNKIKAEASQNAPEHEYSHCPPVLCDRTQTYLLSSLLIIILLLPFALPTRQRLLDINSTPQLVKLIPAKFSDWQHDLLMDQRFITSQSLPVADTDEHQTLTRTYINSQGQRVMLLISYGIDQTSKTFEEHRPEYCYKTQGFTLIKSQEANLALQTGFLPVKQLVAQQFNRFEPITYWMTVGNYPTLPGLERRWLKFRYAVQGLIPNGMLVRVSSIDSDDVSAFELQAKFIADLQNAVPEALGFAALKMPI
jgi:EpsI family protein